MSAPDFQKTAVLAVADRTGIVEFADGLRRLGYRLLSTGATAQALRQAEIPFEEISAFTGYPEILGGRLRLLHPRLFGGILADRALGDQMRDLDRQGVPPIDLVAANLYPLADVLQAANLKQREVMDFLDVSSSALLRAAARNFHDVVTLCDPRDYSSVLEALQQAKGLSRDRSQALAAKAFYYVSYYDATVAQYLHSALEKLPDEMIISLKKDADLRYGANPHQGAALYSRSGARPWGLNAAQIIFGKPLLYNHYLSVDRAAELVAELRGPACAIVKHVNPAGAAVSEFLGESARLAYESDPEGCTGGVAAFNREVDGDSAGVLAQERLECVVAPDFSADALDALRAKKDIRLIRLPSLLLAPNEIEIKTISGGILLQDRDNPTEPPSRRVVTKRPPSELETSAAELAWTVSKHTMTHAAVLARPTATIGIGGGQTTRLDAVRLAIVKSQERHPVLAPAQPVALASDGVLGPRHIHEAASAGISAVISPGGSSEDREAIAAADEAGMAMIFTGVRHYRH